MLLTVVLVSALLCSVAGQGCLTLGGIKDVKYLIDNLQVTDCLCLPIPSDNCTTPCFQEGLAQMANTTVKASFPLIFNRVKRTVRILRHNKCPHFSCDPPCNQTSAGNTLTFLTGLLGVFQKERNRGQV